MLELNQQQKSAAEYDCRHVLVLAGAGTGKTRTIIARAAFLIQKGVQTRRILLLTFTRRAAKEMVNRLQQMIGEGAEMILAGTFHHFCLYTMRRMPKEFDIEKATVIDRDDQVQLMKLIRGDFRKKGLQLPRASEMVSYCSYARNTLQPMRGYLQKYTELDATTVEVVCKISDAFEQRKRLNNYLDYDDILFRFAKRLHEYPPVREKLREFYDHILVDEMQDTNPLQWLILEGLRDPARLFCVGDDAQSIYAFRGADFRNVHSFTERVPESTVLRLEENYRSTQGILDLSNWLLNSSPIKYSKNLKAHRKLEGKPLLMDFDSDFDEARWIAKDLIERHETGANWRDHMIITRTGYGARAVESFMVEEKIPYRFIGGTSLLQAAHVKDLFSLVRASASAQDELSWARYLTLWPRIGDATASRLIKALRRQPSLQAALDYLKDALKGRKEILAGPYIVLESWDDPATVIRRAGNFLNPLLKMRHDNWDVRKRDFDLLARLAENHRSLIAFLETYTLDPISITSAEHAGEDDLVTLTTVHSAKGTEAPVCYLIRVEPGMYPHIRSLGDRDAEEEERRILYVAMTRAQDELILTRTYRKGASLAFPYSAAGRHSSEGTVYFFEHIQEALVDVDTVDFDPHYFSDYDTIKPWSRG